MIRRNAMSNEPAEPRSNWTLRLIAPKFNDELYLWMSTIPVVCGLIQFTVSFCYYLRFIGLFVVGSSGGISALLIVTLAFLVTIGLFVTFMNGFAYSIASVVMLFEQAPWLLYLWLTIVVVGSLFKNTDKVKTTGDNEDKYGLTKVYFWGMPVTAIIVFIIANDLFTQGLIETGGGNWFFLPFALFACFITIFHFFIKPAITSLIVLYIFLFVNFKVIK